MHTIDSARLTEAQIDQILAIYPLRNPIHLVFTAAKTLGIRVTIVAPSNEPVTITSPKNGAIVMLDDGDITVEELGIKHGGPGAFHRPSLLQLFSSADAVVINAGDPNILISHAAVMMAASGCTVCHCETVPAHFAAWARIVREARGKGGGVLLLGPTADLPFDLQGVEPSTVH